MHTSIVKEARDLAVPYTLTLAAVDTAGQAVVQYIPSLGTGAAAAECAVTTATDLTFLTGPAGAATTPAGADAIGTAGVILFSAYTTMGALADYVNSFQAWRMYLTGALRADASAAKLLVKSTTSCIGANGLTIFADTSAAEHHDVTISGEKFVSNGRSGHLKDWDHQCENRLIRFSLDIDGTGDCVITMYSGKQGSTETSMYTIALPDNTLTERGMDLPVGSFFKAAKRGERLILRVSHATDIGTDLTAFQITGQTAVLTGAHVITEGNNP